MVAAALDAETGRDRKRVWTGAEMLVVGGSEEPLRGVRFDPAQDAWRSISMEGAPTEHVFAPTGVWTGSEAIVFGSSQDYDWSTEEPTRVVVGRYAPATDSWRPVSREGAPSARSWHDAVWTAAR